MSTVKNALTAGGVVAGGIGLIALLILALLGPTIAAIGWFFSWWSFEAAVIAMLLMIAYLTGGGGE